jgi:hypothetical protein
VVVLEFAYKAFSSHSTRVHAQQNDVLPLLVVQLRFSVPESVHLYDSLPHRVNSAHW